MLALAVLLAPAAHAETLVVEDVPAPVAAEVLDVAIADLPGPRGDLVLELGGGEVDAPMRWNGSVVIVDDLGHEFTGVFGWDGDRFRSRFAGEQGPGLYATSWDGPASDLDISAERPLRVAVFRTDAGLVRRGFKEDDAVSVELGVSLNTGDDPLGGL